MKHPPRISDKTKLIALLWLLLSTGFLATTLVSYYSSRASIRESIILTELPLTSDNVYSEIQKDLVRPILISSMMSRDTFVRDWVMGGEREVAQITHYLKEIQTHYGAFTSFFVSDLSRIYYQTEGVLKAVKPDEARDAWYFRVRGMTEPYEINVDPDLANRDRLTIFINYKVFDYQQRFIGATGVGLTVDAVVRMIDDYQERFGRSIYFVGANGAIVLSGKNRFGGKDAANIRDIEGLRDQAGAILGAGRGAFEYQDHGHRHFLNVRYIPELKWHLFVVKQEPEALEDLRRTLHFNLFACAAITLLVLLIVHLTINRYQHRLEQMATTDNLTGLANRHALGLLLEQASREAQRQRSPMSAILVDIDRFKEINDQHGHLSGDRVLQRLAATLKANLRIADIACRWGGEEFLIVLKDTDLGAATNVANTLRAKVEQQQYELAPGCAGITISAGVVAFRPEESTESFIARADQLLLKAKEEGRNRVYSEI